MDTANATASLDTGNSEEFTLTRTFDAPLQVVWDAYTLPEHLNHWWGPKGFNLHVEKMELHPGGTFLYSMTPPNGTATYGKWVFRSVEPLRGFSCVVSFCDENGALRRHPMAPTWPLEMLCSCTFTEENGKTTLVNQSAPWNASEEEHDTFDAGREGMRHGFGGTWDKLDHYLASLPASA